MITPANDDDARESVVEPSPHGGDADNIREQQGTHAAGAVPPAFVGDDSEDNPEDAADNSGNWDELGRETP